MNFDIEPYKRQIDTLADEAVSAVVDNMIDSLKLPDGPEKDQAGIDAAEQIEKYLIGVWIKKHGDRHTKKLLAAVAPYLDQLLTDPDEHQANFYTSEERAEAIRILHERGYETSSFTNEEGGDSVKFWKKGEPEPQIDWL